MVFIHQPKQHFQTLNTNIMALALKKAIAECEAGSGFSDLNKSLGRISPKLKATLDVDSIKALEGKINWTSKDEVDASVAVLKYFTRAFNVLKTVDAAFQKITKDAIGKEAVATEVEKLVIHVVQDSSQTGGFDVAWKVEKQGKEMHLTIGRDWPTHAKDGNNGYPDETALAKLIENTL